MTNHKFTELLNLYLDNEISLEDAAILEAEIQQDPARRALYQQYCRIQKGCSQMADVFGEQGKLIAPAKISLKRKVSRSHFAPWATGLGLAAAAGFALVLMNSDPVAVENVTIAKNRATEPKAQAVERISQEVLVNYDLPEYNRTPTELHPVFTPTLISILLSDQTARSLYVNGQTERFDWMDRMNFDSPQNEKFSFQVRPAVASGQRTFRSQRPIEGQVEMTAFQFQR